MVEIRPKEKVAPAQVKLKFIYRDGSYDLFPYECPPNLDDIHPKRSVGTMNIRADMVIDLLNRRFLKHRWCSRDIPVDEVYLY